MTSVPADAVRDTRAFDTVTGHAREGTCADDDAGTWVMQTDAAARTGFSVSAIRKWRRMGLVADRRITSPTGLERVEVKLEDVLARAALQPERRRSDAGSGDAPVPPGSVVIAIDDLEALFDRMVSAERRAEEAEAVAEALREQATFTFGQIAELRRQLQDVSEATVGVGGRAPTATRAVPAPPVPARRTSPAATSEPPPAAVRAPVRRSAPVSPVPPRAATRPARPFDQETAEPVAVPARSPVEELGDELRRIYARLDEYRLHPVITPEAERRHDRDLAEYDRTLLAVCKAAGIPTGLDEGEPVTVEVRATLTRALARAGLDVRGGASSVRGAARRPRVQPKRRL